MKKMVVALLTVLIALTFTMSAFAAESPKLPIPEIIDTDGGRINATPVINNDGSYTITLTGNPEDGYNFGNWEITGEYQIVIGSLEEGNLVIKVKDPTALTVKAIYKSTSDDGSSKVVPTPIPPVNDNDDSTSPKTGDSASALALLAVGCGVVCLAIARKKLSK